MGNYPDHLAILNAAAEKADWGKPLPPGVYRGLAQFMGYGDLFGRGRRGLGERRRQAQGASRRARR